MPGPFDKVVLAKLRRPSQFTPRAPQPFLAYDRFISGPAWIPQTNPREMKQLVRKNTGEFPRLPFQVLVEDDSALSHVCRCMDRLAEGAIRIKFPRSGGQGW